MSILKRKSDDREFGFGATDTRQRRLINPDGTYNYRRVGLPFYKTFNVYHYLVTASWAHFLLLVFLWYAVVNFLFVGLYYIFGLDALAGMIYADDWSKFWEVYFFSVQTLTTVGYGRINPTGFTSGLIASIEALFGLLSFALVTGLLYARFAKAPLIVMFSKKAIIAPFTWQGQLITGFMFRSANQYNSNLMNMKAQVTLSILEPSENDAMIRKFYPLSLERGTITFFPSSWTVVHPIDRQSPLYGLDYDTFKIRRPEFMILLSGFDETFDQNVFARHSYSVEEIEWGAKFVKIFDFDAGGQATVDLGNLSTFDTVEINHLISHSEELAEGKE